MSTLPKSTSFLLNRLVPTENPMLRHNQNDFRRGRSAISHLLSLRSLIEENKRLNKETSQQMPGLRSLTSKRESLKTIISHHS